MAVKVAPEADCTNMVQHLLDLQITAVVALDRTLTIQYMNAAAEALLDGSRKRLTHTPFFSLFAFISIDPVVLQEAMDEGQSVSDSEVVAMFHDEHKVTLEFTAQPIQLEQTPHILLELRQIDQIKRINQETSQQQQLQAAQSMIRGLAHEIKNPLGGLRGAAQLLASELKEPELREYTDLIMSQADRLRVLVDRMLGSHRMPTRQTENIHALLERAVQVAALSVNDNEQKSIQWKRDYDPSLPELSVAGDAIEQAFLNILMNAVEAISEQGTITVKTRIVHQQTLYGKRYKACAVISIRDDGPGIPAALKDTLFYPMVSGRAEGTGLGLSIAQTIVHQHAGKIEVQSEPGATEFSLYLPYVETLICN